MAERAPTEPTSGQRNATGKRERTRQQVLSAALSCVHEEGVADATAARIAKQCGLSWGVIQYHFGDRSGLLLALFEHGLGQLGDFLAALEPREADPAERLRAMVEGTWSLLANDHYHAMLEVQLHLVRDPAHRDAVRKRARRMRRQLGEAWRKNLPECDPERVDRAQHLATATLRGLALEQALLGGRATTKQDREDLVDTLIGVLGLDGPPR